MSKNISRVLADTRRVLSLRSDARSMAVPPWAINAIIYITLARSVAYGVELFALTSNPVGPLMAFAAIFGLQTWGILMLVGAALILAGLLLKNSIIITIGALLSWVVWIAFGVSLTIGASALGTGARHAVAALASGSTWLVLFLVQLRTIRSRGVPS